MGFENQKENFKKRRKNNIFYILNNENFSA
jgi:hypothetical protein